MPGVTPGGSVAFAIVRRPAHGRSTDRCRTGNSSRARTIRRAKSSAATSILGMPFISTSSGMEIRRSTSSAAWPGHCEMISHVRRRQIRVRINGQIAERDRRPTPSPRAPRSRPRTAAIRRRKRYGDHAFSVTATCDVRELQENAAFAHDFFALLQSASDFGVVAVLRAEC